MNWGSHQNHVILSISMNTIKPTIRNIDYRYNVKCYKYNVEWIEPILL